MSNSPSPIGTLKKKKKASLVKQGIEELINSLTDSLTHLSNSGSSSNNNNNNNSNSNNNNSSSIVNSNSSSFSSSTTPSLSPHSTVTLNNMLSSSPPSSTSTSPPTSRPTSVSNNDPTRSLAKFYLLAQQLEYVGNETYISKPDINDPLLPVESLSGILNVQWTTYWTIPLLPNTKCLEILKYISLKTNREIPQLKVADSEGKLVDHDTILTQYRCKKFIVFEDINVDYLSNNSRSNNINSNNNNNNNSNKNNNITSNINNNIKKNHPNCNFISSPSVSTPSSPTSPNVNSNSLSNLNNITEINLNQYIDSNKSTPLQLSPNIQRRNPPIVPPRSPQSFTTTNNSNNPYNNLFSHSELLSEPFSQTPNNFNGILSNEKSSPTDSPTSSRKNSNSTTATTTTNNNLSNSNNNNSSNLTNSNPNNNRDQIYNNNIEQEEKYCKFLENVQISQILPTTEKGKILDNYFNHYYQELFKYIHTRHRRLKRLEEFIGELGLDQTGGQKWRLKHFEQETNYLRNKRAGMKLKEFKILTQIGKGGFGQVFLAQKKDTGDIVTMKRIKKSSYEWANQRIQVSQEKNVMLSENCKWITKLLYSFQDSNYLYLAMEYHCGGDFRALLNNLGMLSEEEARYYMIEMIEAVQSLHTMRYVHRDIKPSNFVIDKHGHIRLIDFGLSKEGIEKRNGFTQQTMNELRKSVINTTYSNRNTINSKDPNFQTTITTAYRRPTAHSAVGSPEYMAPEIVNDEGYDHTCDWWSLGCVFVEMLCGFNPFCADTPSDVFMNIIQWKQVLDWELFCQDLSVEAADLLKRLLCEPAQRLGLNGAEDFKKHPFFKGHWDDIDQLKPPFIPKVSSDMDTSYFEDAVNNDPNTWEIEDTDQEKKNPFDNLNIPFFTYRKSSALSLLCDDSSKI